MKPLKALNAGKPYAQQTKPFNFILSCHVLLLGHPIGVNPERFHLIAPYETDPQMGAGAVDRPVFSEWSAISYHYDGAEPGAPDRAGEKLR